MGESPDDPLELDEGMSSSGMSLKVLWLRQFALGGDVSSFELEAYLLGLLRPDPHTHDLIAQALNEHFLEHGQDHPVVYSSLADHDPFPRPD